MDRQARRAVGTRAGWLGRDAASRARLGGGSRGRCSRALAGGLLWYALRTDWRTLYADLDPEDARQIGQILAQAQIPFETTADGAGIRVPAAAVGQGAAGDRRQRWRQERTDGL